MKDDSLELHCDSSQEITEATLVALPRGALTEPVSPVPVPLDSRLEPGRDGPRHVASGCVALTAIMQSGCALLRVRLMLASGEVVSRTWAMTNLRN
jgi:hypothetical protein